MHSNKHNMPCITELHNYLEYLYSNRDLLLNVPFHLDNAHLHVHGQEWNFECPPNVHHDLAQWFKDRMPPDRQRMCTPIDTIHAALATPDRRDMADLFFPIVVDVYIRGQVHSQLYPTTCTHKLDLCITGDEVRQYRGWGTRIVGQWFDHDRDSTRFRMLKKAVGSCPDRDVCISVQWGMDCCLITDDDDDDDLQEPCFCPLSLIQLGARDVLAGTATVHQAIQRLRDLARP